MNQPTTYRSFVWEGEELNKNWNTIYLRLYAVPEAATRIGGPVSPSRSYSEDEQSDHDADVAIQKRSATKVQVLQTRIVRRSELPAGYVWLPESQEPKQGWFKVVPADLHDEQAHFELIEATEKAARERSERAAREKATNDALAIAKELTAQLSDAVGSDYHISVKPDGARGYVGYKGNELARFDSVHNINFEKVLAICRADSEKRNAAANAAKAAVGNAVVRLTGKFYKEQLVAPDDRGNITVPKWAIGHLIGRRGSAIQKAQRLAGRRFNLIGTDEACPQNANAEWVGQAS